MNHGLTPNLTPNSGPPAPRSEAARLFCVYHPTRKFIEPDAKSLEMLRWEVVFLNRPIQHGVEAS